ncbi:hypothetical protein C8R44DRAFT_905571 [Mycena epipterygia]|nr:hypothetical protein C8R44DRAFT_905571 [Mycena epipterygia]
MRVWAETRVSGASGRGAHCGRVANVGAEKKDGETSGRKARQRQPKNRPLRSRTLPESKRVHPPGLRLAESDRLHTTACEKARRPQPAALLGLRVVVPSVWSGGGGGLRRGCRRCSLRQQGKRRHCGDAGTTRYRGKTDTVAVSAGDGVEGKVRLRVVVQHGEFNGGGVERKMRTAEHTGVGRDSHQRGIGLGMRGRRGIGGRGTGRSSLNDGRRTVTIAGSWQWKAQGRTSDFESEDPD